MAEVQQWTIQQAREFIKAEHDMRASFPKHCATHHTDDYRRAYEAIDAHLDVLTISPVQLTAIEGYYADPSCQAMGRHSGNADKAISAWNTRASDDDVRDAARYRWLRDTPWLGTGTPLERVIAQQRNAHWDEAIDAAMAGEVQS